MDEKIKLIKEKHQWVTIKETTYLNQLGDPDHHYIAKTEETYCKICSAKKVRQIK